MTKYVCVSKKVLLAFMLIILSTGILLLGSSFLLSNNLTFGTKAAQLIQSPPKYIGGTETTIIKWPFVVMITVDHKVRRINGTYDFLRSRKCTGVIIDKRWVLTAAHCIGSEKDHDIGILIGVDDIVNQTVGESVNAQYMLPLRVIKHESYRVTTYDKGKIMAFADIALLGVGRDIKQNAVEMADRLPSNNNAPVYGIGWGFMLDQSGQRILPTHLQELQMGLPKKGIEYTIADVIRGTKFYDKLIVTYLHENEKSDQGDSGGPLVTFNEQKGLWELIGITSSGMQYTDITQYRAWIDAHRATKIK